jgi:hypothetical protein
MMTIPETGYLAVFINEMIAAVLSSWPRGAFFRDNLIEDKAAEDPEDPAQRICGNFTDFQKENIVSSLIGDRA